MTVAKTKVHHGRNIMRLREGFNRMTQEALGLCVGYSQSQISKLEDQEVIEDEVLIKFANLFGYKWKIYAITRLHLLQNL